MRAMPVKGTPYKHQREAFLFALKLFGLDESEADCGKDNPSKL